MVQNAHILRVCSAFSPFRAPGGGISQSSTCALNTNLIFEIGSINLDLRKTIPTSTQVIRY